MLSVHTLWMALEPRMQVRRACLTVKPTDALDASSDKIPDYVHTSVAAFYITML